MLEQYWIFLQQLFTGNLGTSYSFQAPALQVVLERMPYTLTLATAAILLTAVVAIPLGVWMARRAGHQAANSAPTSSPSPGSRCRTSGPASCCSPASPSSSRCFPASGFATWGGLVLPTVTIAILQIALISRMVRREMVGNFAAPYLTVARSRGVAERLR